MYTANSNAPILIIYTIHKIIITAFKVNNEVNVNLLCYVMSCYVNVNHTDVNKTSHKYLTRKGSKFNLSYKVHQNCQPQCK